jgi:tRNA-dihydrouridine synthase B
MNNLQINNNFPIRRDNISGIPIGNGVFLAPMEDVSDLPFRIVCKNLGADIVYSEFISSEGIIRDAHKAKRKMTIDPSERPTAIQIFGGDEDAMVESAKIVEQAGADILDINFGCWVKKVVVREAGAAFLKQPEKMADLTNKLVNAVKIPVTVKTRLGWSKNDIVIEKVAKLIEQSGAKALAIHCRTRDMGMTGAADWSYINPIRNLIDIPVILNGDVDSPEKAKLAFDSTGCDAMMIGRACIGYPFIFKQIQDYLNTGTLTEIPIKLRIETCLFHLKLSLDYKGSHAMVEFRKHYSGYLKGYYNASPTRQLLMKSNSFEEVEEILFNYLKFLEVNDKLEPIGNSHHIPDLSCTSEKKVAREMVLS